jgi:uncharacterized membrane protein
MRSTSTKVGWSVVLLGTTLLALSAARYFTFDPDVYFAPQRQVYQDRTLALMLHISGMLLATLIGPWQFLRPLRRRHPRLHRGLGATYVLGAIVGGTGGLLLAPHSAYGAPTHVAFALLAIGVLVATPMACLQIHLGNVQRHREWMTRSFALILAGVTLRLYTPLLGSVLGEHHGYVAAAWLCWPPNLLVAEWLVRTRRPRPTAAGVQGAERALEDISGNGGTAVGTTALGPEDGRRVARPPRVAVRPGPVA